ncbi:M10 family metallopeptidase C-terminal domain-containing protein [Pseudomonas sp. A34-9]|uniref:M10 family metallopeptidase C-terminal domain-containing protein n=1 Tax=Pseudomonas sp. A34-9 TaxID=3034675 RepID=UPI00240D89E7|nr:M10 family metallopeptidase C-terminal domain-containing protein [Pseudomonas sp. A34-9]
MPTPTTYSFSFPSSLTGNKSVDSLISGTYWLGSNWSPFGTTQLSYSFISETTSYFATKYSPDNEYTAAYALTSAQQNAVIGALSAWSAVANINFTLTTDNLSNVGDLRFGGYLSMDPKTAAWAYFPDDTPRGGDVWIGPATNSANPVQGTYDYLTFVHEIGHALGLKHPFSPSASNTLLLDPALDSVFYTVMSYNDSYSYQPTTPMLLDILAIQSLYGANSLWHNGDNVYKWAPNQSVFETIWDAGGNDTIDGSNQLQSVRINLNEGAYSTIGKAFLDLTNNTAVTDALTIAFGAKIENAIGSASDDTLIGNALNNILDGKAGADIMSGGAGNDSYVVDNAGDTVIELGTSLTEIDSVFSYVNYALGSNLENLILLGSDNLNGTGNTLNNTITGNAANNILDGGAGIDTLIGGTGNDTYIVDNTQDVVVETSALTNEIDTVMASVSYTLSANVENLTLTGIMNTNASGNAQNNVLTGNSGNNILNGDGGLDTLIGGAGNDTYLVDQVGELALIQELASEGLDTLYIGYTPTPQTSTVDLNISSLRNIENVTLQAVGAFSVLGNDLNNTLLGNAQANNLQGGAGNDILNGGAGVDTLSGGTGDDTYIVDNANDIVIEAANEGVDLVQTTVSYVLSANIEAGQILGSDSLNLVGNDLSNTLTGNSANNILDGKAGADIMSGGAGNDSYVVDNAGDTVIELGTSLTEIDSVFSYVSYALGSNLENLILLGSDNLNGTGNTLNNTITGNAANNTLDGGAGIDTLIGGTGNDTYIVDNTQDVVVETSALTNEIDTVMASVSYTLSANVENLTLTGIMNTNASGNAQNNVLTGNSGNNILNGGDGLDTLIGGAGNDILNGGAGVDTLSGGTGDDTYIVDNANDIVIEAANEGVDLVQTTVSYVLSANIEAGQILGSDSLNLVGNDLSNTLTGNSANNILDGKAGADIMSGGAGNDSYVVDNAGDTVIELGTSLTEIDSVFSYVSYALGSNLENLILLGSDNLNGTGNTLNNTITGNAANNILDGGAGIDTLIGGAGDDTYIVDNANDIVIEAANEGVDLVQTTVSYILSANIEAGQILGSDSLNLVGNDLSNTLTGNSANNILDGKAGADIMSGGAGNDSYVVDNAGDTVIELGTSLTEIDSVFSYVSYALGSNLENLILLGSDNLNGTGNTLNNTITGNAANNTLDGGAGIDTLIGGTGNDTYIVDNTQDVVVETSALTNEVDTVMASVSYTLSANVENLTLTGIMNTNASGNAQNNVLTGNSGNNILNGGDGLDTLIGGAGNDILNGGAGVDTLSGGTGDDTYIVDNANDIVIEAANEGVDLVQTTVSYVLSANIEAGQILGSDSLNLVGNDLSNTLTGNSANNILDGKAGADIMSGGAGNDSYVVDNAGDTVIELGTSLTEIDSVFSYVNYALGSNLENLILLGSDNLNGTGNTLNNTITGNAANNTLDGGAGIDTLIGGTGNDTYIVDNTQDVVVETSALTNEIDTVMASVSYTLSANVENLTLTGIMNTNASGNAQNNVLTGNSGNNILNGGDGLDTLIGGAGNDTYLVDQVGELALIQELASEGLDTLYIGYTPTPQTSTVDLNISSLRNIENVTLQAVGAFSVLGNDLNNTLLGNAQANNLQGGAGNDILNGGAGVDTLSGGTGDDTYIVDNANDIVIEAANEGVDLVQTTVSYVLSANIEAGQILGSDSLNLVGNDLSNTLTGNSANNILDGKAGADIMSGGAGNDSYVVDNAGDTVIELGTSLTEIDSVFSYVSYALGSNLENLILLGSDNLNGTGNTLNNTITGNAANNILDGGAGIDTLIGGTGADTFVFAAVNEMGIGANRDVITDFNSLQGDKIDLTKFDANLLSAGVNGFSFIGANAFTGAGQLRFVDHVLSGNVSGNAGADFEIQLVGVNSFSANDLVA